MCFCSRSSTNAYMLCFCSRSSTNAYMLVYRQIDKTRNEDFIKEEMFKEELRAELHRLQNIEEEEKRLKELEKSTCKVHV